MANFLTASKAGTHGGDVSGFCGKTKKRCSEFRRRCERYFSCPQEQDFATDLRYVD
jgi:hypothetical protein